MRPVVQLLAIAAVVVIGNAGALEGQPAPPDPRAAYVRPADIPYPPENPWSEDKAALGATLFFDPILSGTHSVACVSCHHPELAWADNLPRAIGDRHEPMALRSPTLLDLAWAPRLGWDGKFQDIEDVALRAMITEGNMDLPVNEALDRLAANPAYVHRFDAVFGTGGITKENLLSALATYVRTIVSEDAPFDHWVRGDETAISDSAKRGFALFNGKAGCSGCHSGYAFTDYSFEDIGVGTGSDIGRGRMFPTSKSLRYAFKVPSLRDVTLRAPYMHDGSIATLADVIDLYNRGGIDRPSRSPKIKPLGLTSGEKEDLIDFLGTLTGKQQAVTVPLSPH